MNKVNKGGRPRKNAVSGGKPQPVGWKKITNPVSIHHYEVSSQGEVRRKKKDGSYYNLKPWVTGGPYAAVYLTGVKSATRNRKKVYVHRLVATHFVQGKTSGKVVHHKVGPGSNTAQNLQWVTHSQNLKARKFFNDDGSRKKQRSKGVAKPKKSPKNVPVKKSDQKSAPIPKEKKIEPKPVAPPPNSQNKLPDDPNEFYNTPTFLSKLTILVKKWKPFRREWLKFRKRVTEVNQKNFPEKFKEATGKKLKLGKSPAAWETHMKSAMFEIERRLERSEE